MHRHGLTSASSATAAESRRPSPRSPAPDAAAVSCVASFLSACCRDRARLLLGASQTLPRAAADLVAVATPLRPLELIEVRARLREARRPHQLALLLRVQVVEPHRLGRIDLVLRDEAARQQLEDVEPALDFRANDQAVVPIHRPRAGGDEPRRVERTAIEIGDLLRVSRRRSSRRSKSRLDTSPGPSLLARESESAIRCGRRSSRTTSAPPASCSSS